jgi:hypothetical protein
VLTNIANINALGAIDAGGGFEWNMFCELVAVVEYDHIFRRSNTLTFGGVGGASSFRERVRRDFDKVLFGSNHRFGGSRRRTSAIHSRVKAESVFESRSPG